MVQKIVKKEEGAKVTREGDYCGGSCHATVRLSESSSNKRKEVPPLIEKQNKDAKGKTGEKKEEAKTLIRGPTNITQEEWLDELRVC